MVRRPGTSLYHTIGLPDVSTDDTYLEHGINLLHGFLTGYDLDVLRLRAIALVGRQQEIDWLNAALDDHIY